MTIANAFYPKVPVAVIERKLEEVAQKFTRFPLRCKDIRHFKSSLGVSYYLSIQNEQPVIDLHYAIYASMSPLIDDHNNGAFNLANFTPHITISGFSKDLVPEVEQAIRRYSVQFEVPFDCFCLCVTDGKGPWTILRKYPLPD
jgi:2'-5' RNA ligase